MKNYPIEKWNTKRGMKVGISSVYVCGNLHRTFAVIYSVPGDWTETALKWCESVAEAFVEILINGYELAQCDFFFPPRPGWLKKSPRMGEIVL